MDLFLKLTEYRTGRPIIVRLNGEHGPNSIAEIPECHIVHSAPKENFITSIVYHNKTRDLVIENVDRIWKMLDGRI